MSSHVHQINNSIEAAQFSNHEDFATPESYLSPEQRLEAVTGIITAIALRIITKRHESLTQHSDRA